MAKERTPASPGWSPGLGPDIVWLDFKTLVLIFPDHGWKLVEQARNGDEQAITVFTPAALAVATVM